MKASELIKKLQKQIKKHGDIEVVAATDFEPIYDVWFMKKSWINNDEPAIEIG